MTRAERKRRVTAGLVTLARRRIRVASIRPGVLGDELVEFADGTCVWLEVRDGTSALRRLAAASASRDVYLCRIEPCFGCSWYQMSFAHDGEVGSTVLARVKQYESKTIWVPWVSISRWRRQLRDQHDDHGR